MEYLNKDEKEKMKSRKGGALFDAVIISTPQKVEHSESEPYKSEPYEMIHQFADVLVFMNAETLLEATLKEGKATDSKHTIKT